MISIDGNSAYKFVHLLGIAVDLTLSSLLRAVGHLRVGLSDCLSLSSIAFKKTLQQYPSVCTYYMS